MDGTIDNTVNNFKNKYPVFKNKTGDHVFTAVCLNYYFFNTADNEFDPDVAEQSMITDGPNDGGFDAVFNDQNSSNKDIIIVQSKYYHNTMVTPELIIGEISKILDTLQKMENSTDGEISMKTKNAYHLAKDEAEDGAITKVVFFTSYNYDVKDKNEKKSKKEIEKRVNDLFSQHNIFVDIYCI